MAATTFNHPRLFISGGAAMLVLGFAAWHHERLGEICGALAAPAAAASPPMGMSSAIPDDKVIRMEAYCYDEGRRRICYVQ